MKKTLLTTVALAALMASTASAQLNAKWTQCITGTSNITSACTALATTRILMLSWVAPATAATAVVGYNIKVTQATTGGPNLCWWTMSGVRAGGFGLGGTNAAAGCDNFLAFFGSPNAAGGWQDLGDGRGRFNIFVANPVGGSGDATQAAGVEFYAAEVQIKGSGTNSCDGTAPPPFNTGALQCGAGAQLRLNDIVLVQEGGPANIDLNTPVAANSNCATWQAGGVCDAVTPTKNATWGAVKALYR
jgi:hypothetical protein